MKIEIIPDTGAFLLDDGDRYLIIADLHFTDSSDAVYDIVDKTKKLIKKYDCTHLVVLGDIYHFQTGGANVEFENLVFDGTGKNIRTAVHYHEDSTGGKVTNCDFRDISHSSQYHGRGINNYGQRVDVINCTFENIQRIGVFTFNPTAETLIRNCIYTGKGTGDFLDYAFEVGNGANIIVKDNKILLWIFL